MDVPSIVSPETDFLLEVTSALLDSLDLSPFMPAAQDKLPEDHHLAVGIWWNLFPFNMYIDELSRFIMNLGIWPLWLLFVPLIWTWNMIPNFLIFLSIATPVVIAAFIAFLGVVASLVVAALVLYLLVFMLFAGNQILFTVLGIAFLILIALQVIQAIIASVLFGIVGVLFSIATFVLAVFVFVLIVIGLLLNFAKDLLVLGFLLWLVTSMLGWILFIPVGIAIAFGGYYYLALMFNNWASTLVLPWW